MDTSSQGQPSRAPTAWSCHPGDRRWGGSLRGLVASLACALSQGGCAPEQEPCLNEIMSRNTSTIRDSEGRWPDWVELHNPGPARSLEGLHIGDDPYSRPHPISPSVYIQERGYLVFWADGEGLASPFHLPFALDASGESVVLYTEEPDGALSLLDRVTFGAQVADESLQRTQDCGGGWSVSSAPTPGRSNH